MVRQARNERVWRWAAIAFLGCVLLATLRPGTLAAESWIRRCLVCGPFGTADAVRNVLLFAPLGFVLPSALGSYWRAFLAVVALTISIEAAQILIPGRDSSPVDILFNSVGGGIGIGLFATLGVWLVAGRRPRVGLVVGYVVALLLGAGVLSQGATPDFPEGTLIGQWAPVRLEYVPFSGLIHSADIEGAPVPAWAIPNGRTTFSTFLGGGRLNVHFTRGTLETGTQLLLRVVMPSQTELLMVGVKADGVVVRPRTNFTRWRVFEPTTVIPAVLADVRPGEDVAISVFRADDRYCVEVDSGPASCTAAVTTGRLWTLGVNAGRWSASAVMLATAFVLICVGLPLGWWGGVALGGLAVGVVGIGWAWIAAQTALGWVGWEVGVLILGAALGAGLCRSQQNQRPKPP